MRPEALAAVRGDVVPSQMVPVEGEDDGSVRFAVFHFQAGVDNSGFVGWLASRIKAETGNGVFVTCGNNIAAGGIFDYTDCPESMREAVFGVVCRLRGA
jgi:hypothetical protein